MMDNITEVSKSIDEIEEVKKYNHNHGPDGRFTSGSSAGGGVPDMVGYLSQGMKVDSQGKVVPDGSHQEETSAGVKSAVKRLNELPVQRGNSKVKYEDIKEYEDVLNKLPAGTKLSHHMEAGTELFEKVSDSFMGWTHTRQPWGKVDKATAFDIGRWMAGRGVITRGPIEIVSE